MRIQVKVDDNQVVTEAMELFPNSLVCSGFIELFHKGGILDSLGKRLIDGSLVDIGCRPTSFHVFNNGEWVLDRNLLLTGCKQWLKSKYCVTKFVDTEFGKIDTCNISNITRVINGLIGGCTLQLRWRMLDNNFAEFDSPEDMLKFLENVVAKYTALEDTRLHNYWNDLDSINLLGENSLFDLVHSNPLTFPTDVVWPLPPS